MCTVSAPLSDRERLWEIYNEFIFQHISFDQHKEIIIEEIHMAGMAESK